MATETINVADFKPSGAKAGGKFQVSITIDNPELLNTWLRLGDTFGVEIEKLTSNFIFEVHKYLMRVTPIDTGELRGGWTAYLDAHNIDYARQILDTSIAEKAPGRDYHISPDGIQIGQSFSNYSAPTSLDVTIINNVPYGYFLETGTSKIPARNFVELTKFKAELLGEKVFKEWFEKISKADDVVPADQVEEITA